MGICSREDCVQRMFEFCKQYGCHEVRSSSHLVVRLKPCCICLPRPFVQDKFMAVADVRLERRQWVQELRRLAQLYDGAAVQLVVEFSGLGPTSGPTSRRRGRHSFHFLLPAFPFDGSSICFGFLLFDCLGWFLEIQNSGDRGHCHKRQHKACTRSSV